MPATTGRFPTANGIHTDNSGPWTNPSNAYTDDTNYARAATVSNTDSDVQYYTGFGFDNEIGASDTIDGIEVEIEGRAELNRCDFNWQLYDDGSLIGTQEEVEFFEADKTVTSGGASDTMGAVLTAAIVRGANFGVAVNKGTSQFNARFRLFYIKVTVYYTAAGGGGSVTGTLSAQETGSDEFSATGSVPVTGTLAAQESGNETFAVTGSVLVSGGMAAQELGADTFAATGSVGNAGITGTLAAQEAGNDNFAGSGNIEVSGALAAQETGSDTFSASGGAEITGALAAQESGADAFSALGTVSGGAIGAMAARESGSDLFAGTGTVAISGALAAQETGKDTFRSGNNETPDMGIKLRVGRASASQPIRRSYKSRSRSRRAVGRR